MSTNGLGEQCTSVMVMEEDERSRKRKLVEREPTQGSAKKRRIVPQMVEEKNEEESITVLTVRRTPRRIVPTSLTDPTDPPPAMHKTPSVSRRPLRGPSEVTPFRSPTRARKTPRCIVPTPIPGATPEGKPVEFITPAVRRAPRSPKPAMVFSPKVTRRSRAGGLPPRPVTEPNRPAPTSLLPTSPFSVASPPRRAPRRRSEGGMDLKRPKNLEVEVLLAGAVSTAWKKLVASFFRVPDGWDARDYFKGCKLSQLTGEIEGGRRVMLGAAATENFEGEDQIYKSIVHAYIIKDAYRGMRLGEEFWAMLGEEFEIPICAYIKLTEAEAAAAGRAMTQLAGEEGMPAQLLAALLRRAGPAAPASFPGPPSPISEDTASSSCEMAAPPGGTEAQKEEYIERFDSLPGNLNERITLEVRRILRDPAIEHPGGSKLNGAAKFWEKLGFEMDPRIFGLVGGDLVVGMSLGFSF